MKLFFISDIHGSVYYLEKAMAQFKKEEADYLIVLGDILYHGARNDLPKEYNPKKVIEILNKEADKIIAVRGNCDSEVDQMVLDFPLMSAHSTILYEGKRLFLTHGHIYNEGNMVKLEKGSVFISGHTHILRAEEKDGIYFINPGSISLAKEGNPNSYGILENNRFEIRELNGQVIKSIEI